jgi:antitoxin component of MazEF toxin-antitoxin module
MSTIIQADAAGAVMLPAELCRAAGVTPGADLVAEVQAGRIVVQPAAPRFGDLLRFASDLPDAPVDLSAQHDHYLSGTPKR